MKKSDDKSKLLLLLKQKNDWLTAKELAKLTDSSVRHIRYLVSSLNMEGDIVLSSDKGYHYNPNYTVANIADGIPANATEREQYIIENAVIRNKQLDINDLIDFFCISDTTFKTELNNIRKNLSSYKIYLKTKNDKLYSVANDSDRSAFSMSMIRDELKNNSFSLENIQRFFSKVDLHDIRQIVTGVLARYQYYLDEYSLMTYTIHLALCVENHKVGDGNTSIYYKDLIEANSDDVIIKIITEVFEELSKYYQTTSFTKEDIFEASMLMTTRIINNTAMDEVAGLDAIVGKDMTELILSIIKDVKRVYSIDLSSEKFLYRFAVHVKNAIIRAKTNVSISEGQFSDLQQGYPFLYLIARYISYKTNEKAGVVLSDNELSYIVLHVGAIIEEAEMQKEKVNCIVLAPDYHVIGKNLCQKISRSLGDILIISHLITDFDRLKENTKDIDLIISTYDIDYDELPVLNIKPFPNTNDLEQLRVSVFKQRDLLDRSDFLNKISRFTSPDLFYKDTNFKDYIETIETLCEGLYQKGLVLKEFKDELLAHEKIAFSSYNSIAIAHSLNNQDISSFIAFAINSTPIIWGDNLVSLVLIVSLKEEDRKEFKEIFQFFSKAITNEELIREIQHVQNYEEFMHLIYNFN